LPGHGLLRAYAPELSAEFLAMASDLYRVPRRRAS